MVFPEQKMSSAAKFKTDKESGLNNVEATAEYYIQEIGYDKDYYEILRLYRLLEDQIDTSSYDYVLNPFNTKVEKYTRFRGRLRNYNIITPVIEMFLSEFGRRNHYPQVIQSNPGDHNAKKKAWTEFFRGYIAQTSINALNDLNVPTGKESKEQPDYNKAKEDFERTYSENRVISGQEALDYIIYDKDLADKYIDLYENYLVCGRPITYKGVNHDDIDFQIVNPLEAYFPHSVNQKYLEDRDWFIRKRGMTPNQVMDYHRGELSKELVEMINEYQDGTYSLDTLGYSSGIQYMSDDDFNNKYKHHYKAEQNALDHYHVVFKSFKRVAILTYLNPLGEIQEMEVEDNYKLDKEKGDISIEYDYRNALYETYKIVFNGHEEFLRTREIPYDRSEVNNSSKVKLPYNGIALCTKDGQIRSVVKSGENYQVLYNVLKYSQETMINKNKDKIAIIPLGLLNKGKQGWDEEKAMYYAEANSTLFIDETSPNAALALQGIKVLDMSLGKYIGEVQQMIDTIKQEWWDVVGMNRQRFGETKASDGKATTEQAIFRSSLISENMLRRFEKMQEKDYGGLLDVSKFAWINGKKGTYVKSDKAQAFLELNAEDAVYHVESDYDVHVVFSGEINKQVEDLKGYMFNATQNGMSMIPVLEAMENRSFSKMKEIITREEEKRIAIEQQNLEADRANQQEIANKNLQAKQLESADKRYVADKQYEGIIDAALIKEKPENEEANKLLDMVQTEFENKKEQRELEIKETETASKIKKEEAETDKIKKETSLMSNQINN